jgi:hypothetical protein
MSPEFLELLRIKKNDKRMNLVPLYGGAASNKADSAVWRLPSLSKIDPELTEAAADKLAEMVDAAYLRIEKLTAKFEADRAKKQ